MKVPLPRAGPFIISGCDPWLQEEATCLRTTRTMTSTPQQISGEYTAALTTVFTPAPSCLTYSTFILPRQGNDQVILKSSLETIVASAVRGPSQDCYPPDFYAATNSTVFSGSETFAIASTYSPGVCPSAWLNVDQTVVAGSVTVATCCPR